MCAAAPKSLAQAGPVLGPVRPKVYTDGSSKAAAFTAADAELEAPPACVAALCGLVANASIAARVLTDPMWAAASRKHQLRSSHSEPPHADTASFRALRYGASRAGDEDDGASSCGGSDGEDGDH